MDTKVILVGLVVVFAAVAGTVAIAMNHSSEDGGDDNTSMDLDGYWYTIDGKVMIEGDGVKDLLSDDCGLPKKFTDLRIDDSKNNVFYGVTAGERIAGTYFDNGRIMFEFPLTNASPANLIFNGVYKEGMISAYSVFSYDFEGTVKECAITYILSKDPNNDAKLQDVPAIKGQWSIYESHVLTSTQTKSFDEGTLTISEEANKGLFICKLNTSLGELRDESQLIGVILNAPIDGVYYGLLMDTEGGQVWQMVFHGDGITVQTVSNIPTMTGLASISCSYSIDGNKVDNKYPNIAEGVYYPDTSSLSCITNGVGKIVKSNTSFMMNVTKQEGPCFFGTIMIDGGSFAFNGIVDTVGHISIFYLYGDMVDAAFGNIKDGKIDLGTFVNTSYLGRSARHLELDSMPKEKFIENPDIIGSWNVSSFASAGKTPETIFSKDVHTLPLFISSVDNGIVKGYLLGVDFVGTYGPTSTGHGSIWLYIPYNGGVLSCEIIVTHNHIMFATMSYENAECEILDMCQVIYTKDVEYSTISNLRVNVFDKEWEAHKIKIWDGDKLNEATNPAEAVKLELARVGEPGVGLDSFFNGALTFTIPGAGNTSSVEFIGAFYEMGVYGNAIANIYGLNSDCISLSYFDGLLYIHGSFDNNGKLLSFHMIFKQKGTEAKDPFNNKYYQVEGSTFKNGNFSMTVTNQEDFYVYGTINATYDGKVMKGNFIGLQLCIGGPVYIETVLKFDDGKVWDAHVVLIANENSEVVQISFETIWSDAQGNSQASRVIANVE